MINTEKFMELLRDKLDINEFIGVPCSNLKYLINYAENKKQYIQAPNEGEAVAYSVGAHLAGRKVAVMMQNSGFANALNVITSMSCIYKIPQLFMIGFRGMHGEGTDEPQHLIMGRVTEKWLIDCGIIPILVNQFKDEEDLVNEILSYPNKSVALLFDKKDCSKVDLVSNMDYPDLWKLSRTDVLRAVNEYRDENTVVIATTGFTGRDLYDHFENPKNFYMVGSMGCALSLGCGIAKSKPHLKVVVLDGDGAVMMRPQGGILAESLKLNNLLHLVLDNHIYESTGGQFADSCSVYSVLKGIRNFAVTEVTLSSELESILDEFYDGEVSSHRVAVVRVNPKLNDNNLGRPKESSVELANRFMEAIK